MLKLTINQQVELLSYIKNYSIVDPAQIKQFLKNSIKSNKIKASTIANDLELSIHTIYSITKKYNTSYKPDFATFLAICNYLKLPITAITESCDGCQALPENSNNSNDDNLQGDRQNGK